MIAAPAGELRLRVWVTDVWDTVTVAATRDMTIAAVKTLALARATGRRAGPPGYQVKFRGALITDEGQTLAQLHVPDHAPLIVLPARRQPVR
jgi:hypothetical protein